MFEGITKRETKMVLQLKKFDKYLAESDDSEGPPIEEDEGM